jgi:cell division protease FtsH
MLSESERHTEDETYLRAQLVILLAGRAAERLLIGTVSSGADDDIRRATSMARAMVARWGMSPELGPIDLRRSEDHPFLGQAIAQPRDHADATAALVDKAVMELLKQSEATATELLTAHRTEIESLIAELEQQETLGFDEIRRLLDPSGGMQPQRDLAQETARVPHVGGERN